MRILFCNDTYPGCFGRMPAMLAADPDNQVMFLSFYPRQDTSGPEIIHARLKIDRNRSTQQGRDAYAEEWNKAVKLAQQACRTFFHIRESGFIPDMIFVSFADGPALFLRHAFPEAFIVSYLGITRTRHETRTEKLNALMDIQKAQITQSDLYFVRSECQKQHFPTMLHSVIHVRPQYVDTNFFSPRQGDPSLFFPKGPALQSGEIVTFHMKGVSAGSHDMRQLILGLLAHRPHCLILLFFGNGTSKELWEPLHGSLPEEMRARLLLLGGLDLQTYRNMLLVSSVHVFPEQTDAPLQGLLETMSCRTLVMTPVAGDEHSVFADGKQVVDFPESGSEARLQKICAVLDNGENFDEIRKAGRQYVLEHHGDGVSFMQHLKFVMSDREKSVSAGCLARRAGMAS